MPETTPYRIGCIVLAAGTSSRFGSDKRHARLANGSTLLEQTLHRAAMAFEERLLVLRPGEETLASRFAAQWQVVFATDAALGMGHSLAAAMKSVAGWDGAVVILADMPWVRTDTLQAIRAAARPELLVVPYRNETRGNPVAIGRAFFAQLAGAAGDQGARRLLHEHADAILALPVEDPGVLRDADTPDRLAPDAG